MNFKETGGPSFPSEHELSDGVTLKASGLSIRAYFAAKALPIAWKAFEDGYFDSGEDSINEDVAACAYQMADAMLKERAK